MADYYSILNKTLSGLGQNTEQTRALVYEKARAAIRKQLQAMDPPPSEAAVAGQLQLLEDAIVKIDSDYSGAVTDPAPEPEPAPVEEPAVPETDAATEPELPPTQVVPPAPEPENELPEVAAPEAVSTEPPATEVVEETIEAPTTPAQDTAAPEEPVMSETASPVDTVVEPAVDPVAAASAAGAEVPPVPETAELPEVSEPGAVPDPGAVAPDPNVGSVDPTLDGPAAADNGPPTASMIEPEADPILPGDPPPYQQPSGSSGGFARKIGRSLPYLLLLALLAGGGYALWLNKDTLITAFEEYTKPAEPISVVEPEAGTEPASEEDTAQADGEEETAGEPEDIQKEAVRLGSNGEDQPAEPVDDTAIQSEPETEVPVVLDQDSNGDEQTTTEPSVEEVTQSDGQDTSAEPAPVPQVAETAYLYEEGGATAGASRSNGSMAWTLASESPGNGLPPEPVIEGQLNIPEKALSMNLKIKRNADEALPASHIIELLFDTPDGFEGGAIDNVARFVMKSSEQARGEGLVAVPARIDAGYFLIALNNLEQAIATNKRLLQESGWIDIPLGYSTGRRALVTFEKGEDGKAVFEKAFADWENR